MQNLVAAEQTVAPLFRRSFKDRNFQSDQVLGNIWQSVRSSEGGSRMSSEAAAYFPGALAIRPGVRESVACDTEVPLELLDTVQSQEDAHQGPTETAAPISELSDNLVLEQVQQRDKARTWSRVFRAGHTWKGTAAKNGDTQQPFGCVFYPKDKSSIVYGFDLNQQFYVKRTSVFQA
jgi:hypothetical protein